MSNASDSTRDSETSDVIRRPMTLSSLVVDYATELDVLGDVGIHSYIVNGTDITMAPSYGDDYDHVPTTVNAIETTFSESDDWRKPPNDELSTSHDVTSTLFSLNGNHLAATDKSTWNRNRDLNKTEIVHHDVINWDNGQRGNSSNTEVGLISVGEPNIRTDKPSTIDREVTFANISSELHEASSSNGSPSIQEDHQSTHRPEFPLFESVAFDNTGWNPLPEETFYSWLLRRSGGLNMFRGANVGWSRIPVAPGHFPVSDDKLRSWGNSQERPLSPPSSRVEFTAAPIIPFVPAPTVYTGTEAVAAHVGINLNGTFHSLSSIPLADDILSDFVIKSPPTTSKQPVTDTLGLSPVIVNDPSFSSETTFLQPEGPRRTPYESENASRQDDILNDDGGGGDDGEVKNEEVIPNIDLLALESTLNDKSGNEEYIIEGPLQRTNNSQGHLTLTSDDDSFLVSEKEYGFADSDLKEDVFEMPRESIQSSDRSSSRIVLGDLGEVVNSEVELVAKNKISSPASSYSVDGHVEAASSNSNDWTGDLIGITMDGSSLEEASSDEKNKSFPDKKVDLDEKQTGHAVPSSDTSSSEDWLIVPSSPDSAASSIASSVLLSPHSINNNVPQVPKDLTILSTSGPEWQETGHRRDSDNVSSELIHHAFGGFKEGALKSEDEKTELTDENNTGQDFIPSSWPVASGSGVKLGTTAAVNDHQPVRAVTSERDQLKADEVAKEDFWRPSSLYSRPVAGLGSLLHLQPVSVTGTFQEVPLSPGDPKDAEQHQRPPLHWSHAEPSTIFLTAMSEKVDVHANVEDTIPSWTAMSDIASPLPTVASIPLTMPDAEDVETAAAFDGSPMTVSSPSLHVSLGVDAESKMSESSSTTPEERTATSEATKILPKATDTLLFAADVVPATVSPDNEGQHPHLSWSHGATRPSTWNLFDDDNISPTSTKQVIREKNERNPNLSNHSYLEVRENTRRLI